MSSSLQEAFATLAIAGDMRGAGGPLLAPGPQADTVIASVSPTSVALLRPEYARPVRSWFSKPSMPFTTTAVWDSVNSKLVSASQSKVLSWSNSEKAVPSVVIDCQTEVLSVIPYSAGVAVICKNGLAFQLQYDRPNWDVQVAPPVKGSYSWAAILEADEQITVVLLAEDGKSIHRFPLKDASSRTIVKTPAKFTITTCCLHNDTLFVGNGQGKVLFLDGESLVPSKIDLKLEAPDHLSALISCGRDVLVASQTKVSLWDEHFGLMKTSASISFTPWSNKGMLFNGNKALFVCFSLMVLPLKIHKWSLAALTGSKKRKLEKKPSVSGWIDVCDNLCKQVDNWSSADICKQLQRVDELSETFIVKCWKRMLVVDPNHQALVNKLIVTRHECHKLTEVLHEFVTLEEVLQSIEVLASCMAEVSLSQLASGNLLESLMDWACHLMDAHRNVLKVSLRAENEATSGVLRKLDLSLRRIEALSQDLRESRHNLKVALDKTDKVTVPREKIYWIEPWSLLDSNISNNSNNNNHHNTNKTS